MPPSLSGPAAEILALQALAWLAGEPERLEPLLAASGLAAGELKEAAQDPHLLAAILAFLLADEPLLLEFCAENGAKPPAVHAAQHILEGACD